MASAAQITANIANAQHSTGPVTGQGKARSSANSIKFGFYSKQAVLLTAEDHQEFQSLTESYKSEFQPQTAIEETLFTQIILTLWNLQRANCLEAKLALTEGVDPLLSSSKIIDRIHTFRNRAERSYSKLLNEFRLLKSAKQIPQNEPNFPPSQGHYMRTIQPPYMRPQPKIGRNEPCPCKSGRKHKQCCLQDEPK